MTDKTIAPAGRAERYLPTETVQILHPAGEVNAIVPGRRESASVRWSPEAGWLCSCRAKSVGCGHIAAVRQIVILDPEQQDKNRAFAWTGDTTTPQAQPPATVLETGA